VKNNDVADAVGGCFSLPLGGDSKPKATPVSKYGPAPRPVVVVEKQVVVVPVGAPVEPVSVFLEFDAVHFDFNQAPLKPAAKKNMRVHFEIAVH
jgi:outer membrane protein OmpA-like peptidoglycan-associated protein